MANRQSGPATARQATSAIWNDRPTIGAPTMRTNATVPTQGRMRGTINHDEAMRRFADRLPAYLNY